MSFPLANGGESGSGHREKEKRREKGYSTIWQNENDKRDVRNQTGGDKPSPQGERGGKIFIKGGKGDGRRGGGGGVSRGKKKGFL